MFDLTSIVGRSKVGLNQIKKALFGVRSLLGIFAFRTKRTKTNNPILAHNFSNMSRFAHRPMFTEASRVPLTFFHLRVRVYMQVLKKVGKNEIKEEYLAVSIFAAPKFREKVTFWHFGHVVFVKKLAVVALFAQTSEPMLTDDMLVECDVAKLAIRASRTHVDFEQIADHCSRL